MKKQNFRIVDMHISNAVVMVGNEMIGIVTLEDDGTWSCILEDESLEVNDLEVDYADSKEEAAQLLYDVYTKLEGESK